MNRWAEPAAGHGVTDPPGLPAQVVQGDPRHGVVIYAEQLAAAGGWESVSAPSAPAGRHVHVHFTERLWGDCPETAAEAVLALGARCPFTVTLHDLPQASDGASSRRRRAQAHRQVADAARGVVVNSRWELGLLGEVLGAAPAATVIPLAVPDPLGGERPDVGGGRDRRGDLGDGPVIAVLGWVYPGKGHADAIAAAAQLRRRDGVGVGVLAIGAVSPGHEGDAAALSAAAALGGVRFAVSGFLTDRELLEAARRATVPLSAHEHVSASASINTWLSAGRRPLVVDSAYAREIDALRPGTICRYRRENLTAAVRAALADPDATRLPAGADLRPGTAEIVRAYAAWWTGAVNW